MPCARRLAKRSKRLRSKKARSDDRVSNGVVLGVSLREEDIDGPVSGNYSETGLAEDAEEF